MFKEYNSMLKNDQSSSNIEKWIVTRVYLYGHHTQDEIGLKTEAFIWNSLWI